jgi:drug/metabolite transporter (DMT)-like permease
MASDSAVAPRVHPYLVLGLGLLAVSAASIFIRYAQAAGAPSLSIAAYRLTLASLTVLPAVLARHRAELQRLAAREWAAVAVSGLCLGLHFGTWITSLAYTTVANSVVLVSTAPLFVAVLAGIFLRERLTRAAWLGLGLAVLGSGLVAAREACLGASCLPVSDATRGEGIFGDGLALAGGAAMALYLVIGRRARANMSLTAYIGLTYGAAAVTLLSGAVLAGQPLLGLPTAALPWIALLALIPQLLGHSSLNWALKYLPTTFVAVTVLGEPVGSIGLAWLLFQETPTPLKLMGGGLILLGILLASQRSTES